jgi:hypothetical protein
MSWSTGLPYWITGPVVMAEQPFMCSTDCAPDLSNCYSCAMIPVRAEHYNPPDLTLRCAHCGVKASEHEKFCEGCGAPL